MPAQIVNGLIDLISSNLSVVAGVSLSSGGSGYTQAPTVTFAAVTADGAGAQGTAVISAAGVVTSVVITDGGSGYTQPPTVTFASVDGNGSGADGTVTMSSVTCWDGEVPRQDASGNAINPDAQTVPVDWPVVKVYMKESGFSRTWTTEDAYDDLGGILIQVWGTGRSQVENLMNSLEALFAQAAKWQLTALGGPVSNPYYVIQMLLATWYSGQEEGARTQKSELLYRGDLHYDVQIHGAIVTL